MIQCIPTRSPPCIRSFANDAAKGTRKMRLIRKPTCQSDLAEGPLSFQHCALSEFDPPAHEVNMRRYPERLFEGPTEVAITQTGEACQIAERDSSGEVGIDMSHDLARLPQRESSPE